MVPWLCLRRIILNVDLEALTTIVAVNGMRAIVSGQPAYVLFVAARAVRARQNHVWHRLANQRETEPSRLRQQRQQLRRVTGYRELLVLELYENEVVRVRRVGDRLHRAANDPGAVRTLDQVELPF